jgi:coproporphyrinogen III oxidase-like Fe-S oxidoreductase
LKERGTKWTPRSRYWELGMFDRKKLNARLEILESDGIIEMTRNEVRLTTDGDRRVSEIMEEFDRRFRE